MSEPVILVSAFICSKAFILEISGRMRPEEGGIAVERYLTDAVYARRVGGRPPELEREEKHLYAELSARIPGEEYLRIEEELNHFHEELGKELFGRGFMEGMRFFLQCLSP